MQVKVLALSTMALLFSGIARSEAPEDISVTYPQQYIVYDSDNSSSDPTLPEEITRFQYTIQVGTDPAVDNVYYHLTQYFQKSSPIDDPNYHVSGAATRGEDITRGFNLTPMGRLASASQALLMVQHQKHLTATVEPMAAAA